MRELQLPRPPLLVLPAVSLQQVHNKYLTVTKHSGASQIFCSHIMKQLCMCCCLDSSQLRVCKLLVCAYTHNIQCLSAASKGHKTPDLSSYR